MTGVYPIEAQIIRFGSTESIKALNRRLHWRKQGIVYQRDPRHSDVLVKDLGLEQSNSVQTPATHDATEEEPEPLDHVQHSEYTSQVARCLFFSQDLTDVTFIVQELCQRMSNPTQQSLATRDDTEHMFSCGSMVEEVTTCSDSDWAGSRKKLQNNQAQAWYCSPTTP